MQKYESGGVILSAKRVTFSDFLHPLEMDLSWLGAGVRSGVRQNARRLKGKMSEEKSNSLSLSKGLHTITVHGGTGHLRESHGLSAPKSRGLKGLQL